MFEILVEYPIRQAFDEGGLHSDQTRRYRVRAGKSAVRSETAMGPITEPIDFLMFEK